MSILHSYLDLCTLARHASHCGSIKIIIILGFVVSDLHYNECTLALNTHIFRCDNKIFAVGIQSVACHGHMTYLIAV